MTTPGGPAVLSEAELAEIRQSIVQVWTLREKQLSRLLAHSAALAAKLAEAEREIERLKDLVERAREASWGLGVIHEHNRMAAQLAAKDATIAELRGMRG